jgi:hypothetical protein
MQLDTYSLIHRIKFVIKLGSEKEYAKIMWICTY